LVKVLLGILAGTLLGALVGAIATGMFPGVDRVRKAADRLRLRNCQ